LFFLVLAIIAGGSFAWGIGIVAGLKMFLAVGSIGQVSLIWLYRRELVRVLRRRRGRF